MRVLISADAEGVTGITNTSEPLIGRPYFAFMRTVMTDDCNAAGRVGIVALPGSVATNLPSYPRSNGKSRA
jgi:D-aminopeptidase